MLLCILFFIWDTQLVPGRLFFCAMLTPQHSGRAKLNENTEFAEDQSGCDKSLGI